MPINQDTINTIAPDSASLKASSKLAHHQHWPLLATSAPFIWGHCQGSGKNPYLTVVNIDDLGYKCSCPSRKFPCKHVLALMQLSLDDASKFVQDSLPDWVESWSSRRRTTTAKKNTTATKQPNPKTQHHTQLAITQGLTDLEQWLNDQLRTGLAGLMEHAQERCRQISTRLTDAKATTLATRLDSLPNKLSQIPHTENRLRFTINELGKIIWLCRAWQHNPDDADVRRAIMRAEERESVVSQEQALRRMGIWQIVAVYQEPLHHGYNRYLWLRLLEDDCFALIQDYLPTYQDSGYTVGHCLAGEVVYYPSAYPLRALLQTQEICPTPPLPTVPAQQQENFYQHYQQALAHQPWLEVMPYLLPAGRIVQQQQNLYWWQHHSQTWHIPLYHLNSDNADLLCSSQADNTFILWDGVYANHGSSHTQWGVLA